MLLQKIIFKNFRQFESAEIKLSNRENKHISIIFGANGSGKTTILSGIVWALYGGKKLPYAEMEKDFLNKNVFASLRNGEEAEVKVILTFEDKGKNYEIRRFLKVKKIDNKQSISQGPDLELYIDNKLMVYGKRLISEVLDKNLKDYFFFDGENIGSLADSTNPRLVQNGIKNIMKISILEEAIDLIKKVKREFEKEADLIQKESGLGGESLEERILLLEEELEALNNRLKEEEENKNFYDRELRLLDKQIKEMEIVAEEVKKQQEFIAEKENLKKQIQELKENLKKSIRESAYLGISKELLEFGKKFIKEKEEKGELPVVGISIDFIENLLRKGECICGEKIEEGDKHYLNLKNLMSRAVSQSDLDKRMHNLHVFIDKNFKVPFIFKEILDKYQRELEVLERKLKEVDAQLEEIEKEVYDEKKIGSLKDKHYEYREKRDETLKNIGNIEREINIKEADLKEIKKKLEENKVQNEELKLIRRRIILCQKAIDLLNSKKNKRMAEIREKLSRKLGEKFQEILRSNKTAKIDEKFKLVIEENGKVSPKSRGESKLISLLFISCLIDLAKEEEEKNNENNENIKIGAGIYPIVVDSPYGELDTEYKKSISSVLKQLAPQVVLLLNQSQWDRNIEEIFSDSLSNVYRLIAHRPKLRKIKGQKNIIDFKGKTYELEVPDEKEYTTIERIDINDYYETTL